MLVTLTATIGFSPEWTLHSSRTLENGVTSTTYFSQAIPLKPGHMIYTKPSHTPLKMPEGEYAITYFFGDIVDDQHQPVPLSEVYDHHWIAVSSTHRNALCDGGLRYTFGIGAESRNNPVSFPDGYGYVVPKGTSWGANIHLLRTEGLAGANEHQAAKECNECYYAETKGSQCTPQRNGTFQCCGENDYTGKTAHCPVTAAGAVGPAKNYRLRYTFNHTTDVSQLVHANVGTFSAPDCATFYNVLRDDSQPVSVASYTLTLPHAVDLLFARGHQHTGAINSTLSVNGKLLCTSVPRYGTELGVAGNEKGYLVQVSDCHPSSKGVIKLQRGDRIRLDGYYYVGSKDERLLFSDGTHLNVMTYMYTFYVRTGLGFVRGRPVGELAAVEQQEDGNAPDFVPDF